MALDVGDTRVGVAVSDELGLIASPCAPFRRRGGEADVAAVAARVRETGVTTVVVGLPRNMDGSEGIQAQKVRGFGDQLAAMLSVPVYYWDERLSTREALARLRDRGAPAGRRRLEVDGEAASIILDGYLLRLARNVAVEDGTPVGPKNPGRAADPPREEAPDE
jgi:putative Holliday junction resolvase